MYSPNERAESCPRRSRIEDARMRVPSGRVTSTAQNEPRIESSSRSKLDQPERARSLSAADPGWPIQPPEREKCPGLARRAGGRPPARPHDTVEWWPSLPLGADRCSSSASEAPSGVQVLLGGGGDPAGDQLPDGGFEQERGLGGVGDEEWLHQRAGQVARGREVAGLGRAEQEEMVVGVGGVCQWDAAEERVCLYAVVGDAEAVAVELGEDVALEEPCESVVCLCEAACGVVGGDAARSFGGRGGV